MRDRVHHPQDGSEKRVRDQVARPTKPAQVVSVRLSGGSQLQSDNSSEYESDADQPTSGGRLSKQYNSQNQSADRPRSDLW